MTTLTRGSSALEQTGLRRRCPRENNACRSTPRRRRSSCRRSCPSGASPMQPHGHSPTSGRSSQSGRGRVHAATVRSRRRRAREPQEREQQQRRRRRSPRYRRSRYQVADRRVPVVAEVVAVEQRVVPEPGVAAQSARHRVQVVPVQVEVVGRSLHRTRRPARAVRAVSARPSSRAR